ncbi:MAG: hypothetical protein HY964_10105 [Ignavibacteriales bacterium]|nr:hypothetical protein [Ignavibacteriales bacterium]
MIGCNSHEGEAAKDLAIADQSILRISINNRNNKIVDLTDSADIQYFLSQLRSLTARKEANVNNEFHITFYKKYDEIDHQRHITTLRMSKDCIGPMVPSSEVANRWYFENDSLYNFIINKYQSK